MAEPTTFPEEHVQEPIVYRRLSILAIVSCAVAVLFALALLFIVIGSLRERTPVFISLFFQFIPAFAALVGLVALVAIRRSEGVLAGAAVARVGLWVGLVTALGYWAYLAATYFATCQQADVFTTKWIRKVHDGKMSHALLDTIDPKIRQSINPEDEQKLEIRMQTLAEQLGGPMPSGMFRRNKVIKPMLQTAGELRIEPQGVLNWEYKFNAFHVTRGYRLVAPEAAFDIKLTTIGATSPTHDWQGREWKVSMQDAAVVAVHPTELGRRLDQLRFDSLRVLQEWGLLLTKGDLLAVYMYSLPLAERRKPTSEYAARLYASRLAAGSASLSGAPLAVLANSPLGNETEAARRLFLPGYDATMHTLKLFQFDKLKADDPQMRESIQAALAQFMGGPYKGFQMRNNAFDPMSSHERWKYENGLLQLPHDFVMIFGLPSNPSGIALQTNTVLESEADPYKPPAGTPNFRVKSVGLMRGEDGDRFRREVEGKVRARFNP